MTDNGESWKAAFPKPTVEFEDVLLYHADCLEILPQMKAGSVDAVVTDPPYNVGCSYNSWDDSREDYEEWSRAWFTDARAVGHALVMTPGAVNLPFWCLKKPDWVYCWLRTAGLTPAGRAAMRMGWEPIASWGFPLKPLGLDVLNYAVSEQAGVGNHPCPKPLGLFRFLVERWTRSSVADPFMGSGTTGVACVQLNRRFVGIEIDEGYFAIAVKRIERAIREEAGKFAFARAKAPDPQMSLLNA
jgi:site-specific DNA-methyltransferase (adenine-specific)